MTAPAISIVMPTLNQANFLRTAVDSVLNQQGAEEIELLVLDGGSTDGSLDILRSYGAAIRFWSGPDEGQSDAVNKGLSLARGAIVGWLNSDDIHLPGAFHRVLEAFRDPEVQWIYGRVSIIDEEGLEIRRWITRRKDRVLRRLTFGRLLEANWISQMGVFWRREFQQAVGPLRTDLHLAMDYDWWLRFWKLSAGQYVDACLASFRIHDSSKTSRQFAGQLDEALVVAVSHASPDEVRHLKRHRLNRVLIRSLYRMF